MHKFMDLADFNDSKKRKHAREIRAEFIDAIAIWLDKDGMSHNAVLQQVVEKLALVGFASEQEIKETWYDILGADLNKAQSK